MPESTVGILADLFLIYARYAPDLVPWPCYIDNIHHKGGEHPASDHFTFEKGANICGRLYDSVFPKFGDIRVASKVHPKSTFHANPPHI